MESKKPSWITLEGSAGVKWTGLWGELMGISNIYYGLQWIQDILCSYTSSTYCHKSSALKQAEVSKPNAFYKQYLQGFVFFSSRFSLDFSLYKRHTTYTNL